MAFMLKPYRKVYTLTEKNGRIGVCTTAVRKELYAMETVKYLCQESIKFYENLIVANPGGDTNEKQRVMDDFREQLMSFKRIIVHPQVSCIALLIQNTFSLTHNSFIHYSAGSLYQRSITAVKARVAEMIL